jgi:hypothetical protein
MGEDALEKPTDAGHVPTNRDRVRSLRPEVSDPALMHVLDDRNDTRR